MNLVTRKMKLMNIPKWKASGGMVLLLFGFCFISQANNLYNLSCNNEVHVSLGQNGEAEIQPEMLLSNTFPNYDDFVVDITDNDGISYGNTVDCNHIGEEMIGKVTNMINNNSCWSYVVVEDKSGPKFQCPALPVPIQCDENYQNYPAPNAIDNCDDQALVVFVSEDIDDSNICDEVWITRHWLAVDWFGNETECEQKLHITASEVDFPSDISWTCDEYAEYPNITDAAPLHDSLNMTGSGLPGGVNGIYCHYNFNFSDDTLSSCGYTFKILRTWLVFNWCTSQVILEDNDGDTNEQIIEIVDKTGPEIVAAPFTVDANNPGTVGLLCKSTEFLPTAEVTDNCNDYSLRIFTPIGEATYVNGVDGSEGGYIPWPGLNIGSHFITYRATDACGNETELDVLVNVKDLTPPAAICDLITDANVTNEGWVEVYAETFDDGSYDNCCIDHYEVKRMEEPDSEFKESIIFTCEDSVETVVFRVFDCFDNFNECMVIVNVNDNILPICVAPDPMTVTCLDIPAGLDLDDSDALTDLFGAPSHYDNCSSNIEELTAIGNIYCGDGFITRQFVATDETSNLSASCFQQITIIGASDWEIHFPADWYGSCGSVDSSNHVIIDNDGCDLFAITFSDQLYNVSSDSACKQILRTWEVINWCDYIPLSSPFVVNRDPDGKTIDDTTHGNFAYLSYQQTIWITDGNAPLITYNGDTEFCSLDTNCSTGDVQIPVTIQDECTDDIELTYELDLDSDGTMDGSGNGEFSGTLPFGNHTLNYIALDACGNESDLEIAFIVEDCKKPVAICENGLIVEIMQTQEIEVCAASLNHGSYDNCPGDLIISFSADTTHQCQVFYCEDVPPLVPVEIWITDANGNQDFCTTFIDIQDNGWHCEAGDDPLISGTIQNEAGDGLVGVGVSLNGTNEVFTSTDGLYEFMDLQAGEDYTIAPQKDTDPLNGVSTFDLVLISKHILSTQLLNSPYKMIAADVNRSAAITTFDLVELRKMILFIQDGFSNNTSWRFIKKDYDFENPQNPLNEMFPEVIGLNNLDETELEADFVAVKIGDVNGNATTNNLQNSDDRSSQKLTFYTSNKKLTTNESFVIDFKAKDFQNINGFQFTLNFDTEVLEFQDIIPHSVSSKENFGLSLLSKGAITTSWFDAHPKTINEEDVIFSVEFRAKQDHSLGQVLTLNSRFTNAEAYAWENEDYQLLDVHLEVIEEAVSKTFELYQNIPNPFDEATTIGFYLPAQSNGILTIFNTDGKMIWSVEKQFDSGYNEMTINRKTLPQSGVLFYRLDTPEHTATRKMVLQ